MTKPVWSLGGDDWDTDRSRDGSGYRYFSVLATADNGQAWEVARVWVDEDDNDMLDDARLIAAAPKLLKALKTVMCAYGNERSLRWMEELKDEAWAALHQAEGTNP